MSKIREIRKWTGLTQEKFALKYNIPKSTLIKWEQEATIPTHYLIELLEFKVRMDYKIK